MPSRRPVRASGLSPAGRRPTLCPSPIRRAAVPGCGGFHNGEMRARAERPTGPELLPIGVLTLNTSRRRGPGDVAAVGLARRPGQRFPAFVIAACSGRAAAAGPASSASRSPLPAPARRRSNNWRTTPNAKPDSSSEPRPRTTWWPSSSARAHAASTSDVLPIPDRPSTSSIRPRRSSSTSTAASSCSRSRSLPARPACRLRPAPSTACRRAQDSELPNARACPRGV
jgi:hypothetical protein